MSAEDRLREILSSEASTILPAGDGLSRIQERVARRRRLRMLLVPAGALATAAAVAAFVVLSGGAGLQQLEQDPINPATRTPTSEPTATPTRTGVLVVGHPIWPFTSVPEAEAWRNDPTSRPWASSANEVARRFATDFLKLSGVTAEGDGSDVVLRLGSTQVGAARLTQFGDGGPWSVTGVDRGDLTVSAPAEGAAISSPTTVEGRITGLHENVRLQLLSSAGKELAATSAPAGQEAPWTGTLAWSDKTWYDGAIVGTTRSDRDGSLTRIVAVAVSRSTEEPDQPNSFVGLVDGKVLRFDDVTGKRLGQLTYPPAGTTDTAATWSRETLVWVRSKEAGCTNTLYRKTGSQSPTVVQGPGYLLTTPQLSPDTTQLAWVQAPCAGGAASLVVGGRVIPLEAASNNRVLDVDDSGAVLLLTTMEEDTGHPLLRRLPAGAIRISQAASLASGTGCSWETGAFNGGSVIAGETCLGGSRAAHLNAANQRVSEDPFLTGGSRFYTLTTRGGTVIAHTFDSDVDSDGRLGTYLNGRVTPFAPLPGCDAETGAGCVLQPDW